MANASIGYYIHHHGNGHMQRALQIIPFLPGHVVVLSSADVPDNLPANVTYIKLEDDAIEGYKQSSTSAFMYTPSGATITKRYTQILEAVETYSITCMYVDVSMEVALFCKILGVNVGHNVMQGVRNDTAHTNLYRLCDFYIADSTPKLDTNSVRNGPEQINYTGGISRYKTVASARFDTVRNVVVTVSPKSTQLYAENVTRTARKYPAIAWHIVGPFELLPCPSNVTFHGMVSDPRSIYLEANVVIGAAGHNTIMEMASLGKHFVCIPEERPYEEQLTAAEALAAHNMAVHVTEWPEPDQWNGVFKQLDELDIPAFQTLVSNDAARLAAAIIAEHR